jgi:hypothetical protein
MHLALVVALCLQDAGETGHVVRVDAAKRRVVLLQRVALKEAREQEYMVAGSHSGAPTAFYRADAATGAVVGGTVKEFKAGDAVVVEAAQEKMMRVLATEACLPAIAPEHWGDEVDEILVGTVTKVDWRELEECPAAGKLPFVTVKATAELKRKSLAVAEEAAITLAGRARELEDVRAGDVATFAIERDALAKIVLGRTTVREARGVVEKVEGDRVDVFAAELLPKAATLKLTFPGSESGPTFLRGAERAPVKELKAGETVYFFRTGEMVTQLMDASGYDHFLRTVLLKWDPKHPMARGMKQPSERMLPQVGTFTKTEVTEEDGAKGKIEIHRIVVRHTGRIVRLSGGVKEGSVRKSGAAAKLTDLAPGDAVRLVVREEDERSTFALLETPPSSGKREDY